MYKYRLTARAPPVAFRLPSASPSAPRRSVRRHLLPARVPVAPGSSSTDRVFAKLAPSFPCVAGRCQHESFETVRTEVRSVRSGRRNRRRPNPNVLDVPVALTVDWHRCRFAGNAVCRYRSTTHAKGSLAAILATASRIGVAAHTERTRSSRGTRRVRPCLRGADSVAPARSNVGRPPRRCAGFRCRPGRSCCSPPAARWSGAGTST